MQSLRRMALLYALLLLSVPFLRGQSPADPSGHWEGAIQAPDGEVKVEIDLAKNGKREIAGTISIPAQRLKGLSLANFAGEGKSVSFQIKDAPGERRFNGVLSADAKSISGDYTQLGHSLPFSLTRTGDPRNEARVTSVLIGKELEGIWNGTLEANGVQRRIVLTLSNQPDGTAEGHILNIEEGLEFPIAAITQEAFSLRLDIKALGGVYSGALNAEGTELVGTFTQGPLVVPLTFRHTAATDKK